MHSFYLRNMYLENRLAQPGGITLAGEALDLRDVDLPIYQLSTESDHIAPWKSTYALSQLVRGPYRFVLSGSGHIAGVVNPPSLGKYQYWTNDNIRDISLRDWIKGAQEHKGSWWPDWRQWLSGIDAEEVPARGVGTAELPPIENAPGSYVKVRA
jgi:polyhydroxyalkanoate synthase